jgi:hypothetical protein
VLQELIDAGLDVNYTDLSPPLPTNLNRLRSATVGHIEFLFGRWHYEKHHARNLPAAGIVQLDLDPQSPAISFGSAGAEAHWCSRPNVWLIHEVVREKRGHGPLFA